MITSNKYFKTIGLFVFLVFSSISCWSQNKSIKAHFEDCRILEEMKTYGNKPIKIGERDLESSNSDKASKLKSCGIAYAEICINRKGKTVYAEMDEAKTTFAKEKDLKTMLKIFMTYKFEKDFDAPEEECGIVSFQSHKMR